MPIREGQAGVVSDADDDQVVSDQQGIFHGGGGNDASLADRSVDQQKHETDPEPGEDLAADARAYRSVMVGSCGLGLNFQCAPSLSWKS